MRSFLVWQNIQICTFMKRYKNRDYRLKMSVLRTVTILVSYLELRISNIQSVEITKGPMVKYIDPRQTIIV